MIRSALPIIASAVLLGTVTSPSVSLAAGHPFSAHPAHRQLDHRDSPRHSHRDLRNHRHSHGFPGLPAMAVYHGTEVGTGLPVTPGPLTVRLSNGQTVTVTITSTTRIEAVLSGTAQRVSSAIQQGDFALTVVTDHTASAGVASGSSGSTARLSSTPTAVLVIVHLAPTPRAYPGEPASSSSGSSPSSGSPPSSSGAFPAPSGGTAPASGTKSSVS